MHPCFQVSDDRPTTNPTGESHLRLTDVHERPGNFFGHPRFTSSASNSGRPWSSTSSSMSHIRCHSSSVYLGPDFEAPCPSSRSPLPPGGGGGGGAAPPAEATAAINL